MMTLESQNGFLAVIGIAMMVAVRQPRLDLSEIAAPDRPAAQHTRGLCAGRPPIHQYESHVAPPSAKQNTVSDGWKALGGGAQR